MTRTEIQGSAQKNNPCTFLTDKVGDTFLGQKLNGPKEVKVGKGVKYIYGFSVKGGTAAIQMKNADGKYAEVAVNEGDTVNVFATALLSEKLAKAQVGEVLEIVYNGKKKNAKGVDFHSFSVFNITEGE